MPQPLGQTSEIRPAPLPEPGPGSKQLPPLAPAAVSRRPQEDSELRSEFPACRELSALLGYTPKTLSPQEWALCRRVAIAAICRTDLGGGRGAPSRLSRLCQFLALDPGWDHVSSPDLKKLITARSIAQHDARLAERGRSLSTRDQARGALRRIARVEHGGWAGLYRRRAAREAVFLLDTDQLDDMTRRSIRSIGPDPDALALAAQIGAGLPAAQASALQPEQLHPSQGTITISNGTLEVLPDLACYLAAAREHLGHVSSGTGNQAALADVLSRPLWMVRHLRSGTGIGHLNQLSLIATGQGIQRHELERLLPHLHRPAFNEMGVNAPWSEPSTVPLDMVAAVRALQATLTATCPEVHIKMPTHSAPKTPLGGRRPSRAAALRAAKQAAAEGQNRRDPIYLERELPDLPGWSELPVEVRQRITNYRPQRVGVEAWSAAEPIVRRLLAIAGPTTRHNVNILGCHLAPYVSWAAKHLEHANLNELGQLVLEDSTLDRYTFEAMADDKRSTTATRRSHVRGVLIKARPGPRPRRLAYRPVRPPYSGAEAARHRQLARNQPTAARRRGLAFIIAAGYGAGLDGRGMRTVKASDILTLSLPDGDRAVAIRVGGECPRVVVVRDEYADLLLYAVELHLAEGRGRRGLMLGRKVGRKNVTTPTIERLVTADGQTVEIEVPRLRSTWLVAHMNAPVPLAVLLAAAGLKSARAIVDLLPYTSPPEELDRTTMLRAQVELRPSSPFDLGQEESA